MSDESLDDLLEAGRRILAQEEAERQERQEAAERKRQEHRRQIQHLHDIEVAKIRMILEREIPVCLHKFIKFPYGEGDEYELIPPGRHARATIEAPGLVPIRLNHIARNESGDWVFIPIYTITRENPNSTEAFASHTTKDISRALALAEVTISQESLRGNSRMTETSQTP